MSKSVLDMSVSLDGFVAGPNETPENGLGDNGARLHWWLGFGAGPERDVVPGRPDGVNGEVMSELMATGAVVAGRGTVEPAGWWNGDHHDGVPIFILTRTRTADDVKQWPLVTVLDDVTEAITRAKEAAGDRDVLVHGVGCGAAALEAGVLDEVQLHFVPGLLGEGRRLFEGIDPARHHELEVIAVHEGRGVTHVRYRVVR
ncbi:MAG TPA: dihydrofolate reductase family protein [Solirubrobacterales bacterium]|nr:dihydrofolate reductase family protein [Solirubrobacterales bacterium]